MGSEYKFQELTVRDVRKVLDEIVTNRSDYDESVPMSIMWQVENGADASTLHEISARFNVPPWHGRWAKYSAAKDRDEYIIKTCENLRRCAEAPSSHIDGIGMILTPLTDCQIHVFGHDPGSFEDDLARRAHDILKRLPLTPLELVGFPPDLDELYFRHQKLQDRGIIGGHQVSRAWSSLQVSSLLSVNVIQMALFLVVAGENTFGQSIEDYPDLLAELLEVSSNLAGRATSDCESGQWYIVRAALWSEWQRTFMLYQFAILTNALHKGQNFEIRSKSRLRSTSPAPGLSIQKLSACYASSGKPNAMCSWAFELLRTEPACLSSDFRTFHDRYGQLWKHSPSRCRKDSTDSCAGDDPNGCWRFKGMIVEDQSAHDISCARHCPKLRWSEFSYKSIEGAVAVPINFGAPDGSDVGPGYCKATERTMAVTHVWSHGQGGRPLGGVNLCLHQRYMQVARDLGCDSYWWDAACIPEDHALRFDAIQHINGIFSGSKNILICDKDLMEIDIFDLTINLKESILATLLVCDWNLRAWTFLESLKGRHSLYLLCKYNATVSFFDIVRDVADYGSIDLAILSFGVPHMFPDVKQMDFWSREQAGQALSYRPASREGDDTVIWSILVTGRAFNSPEDFWRDPNRSRSSLGEWVATGFLMSSAPRLSTKGLSWAPSTPYFRTLAQRDPIGTSSFRAFGIHDTWEGHITAKGLRASWHVYEFDTSNFNNPGPQNLHTTASPNEILRQICSLYLQNCDWGALLQPMSNFSTFEKGRDTTVKYHGLIRGTLVAVLGCNGRGPPSKKPADDRGWTWKGTFEWNEHVPHPPFKEEHDFLIE